MAPSWLAGTGGRSAGVCGNFPEPDPSGWGIYRKRDFTGTTPGSLLDWRSTDRAGLWPAPSIAEWTRAAVFLGPEMKEDCTPKAWPHRLISLKDHATAIFGLGKTSSCSTPSRWQSPVPLGSSATAIPTKPRQTSVSDSQRKKRSLPRCS
jgi:hypothetical protein